jgi:N-acetylneuraminic acid mutarotase
MVNMGPVSHAGVKRNTYFPATVFVIVTAAIINARCGPGSSVTQHLTPTPPSHNFWTEKAPMPTPCSCPVGVVDGVLYALGAGPAVGGAASVAAYNSSADTWTGRGAMPTAALVPAVGVVNGVLYMVGGQGTNFFSPLNAVWAYDPSTGTWTSKAPMPTSREFLAVGVVNGILYAVGGYDGTNILRTVEAYDPSTNTWTTKAPMPTGRALLGVGVVNGILYAVGGFNGPVFPFPSSNVLNSVEAYDPSTNTWTTKAPMPTGLEELAVGVVNGILYAVGGISSNGGVSYMLGTLEAYDPSTNTWTTKASMPTSRSDVGVGVVSGILYAVGGCCGFSNVMPPGPFNTAEAYTP